MIVEWRKRKNRFCRNIQYSWATIFASFKTIGNNFFFIANSFAAYARGRNEAIHKNVNDDNNSYRKASMVSEQKKPRKRAKRSKSD